jgi:peroxiredoxin
MGTTPMSRKAVLARTTFPLLALAILSLISVFSLSVSAAEKLPQLAPRELIDLTGGHHAIGRPSTAKLTVLVFLGTECPVSNSYAPNLKRLHEAHAARGVQILGVHCDPDVSAQIAKSHASEYQLPFPLVLDHEQQLAQSCGIAVMPTAVVVGPDGQLLYRGQIDNRYLASGVRRPQATKLDLQAAIEAALGGKRPVPATTEPFGCPLPPPLRN